MLKSSSIAKRVCLRFVVAPHRRFARFRFQTIEEFVRQVVLPRCRAKQGRHRASCIRATPPLTSSIKLDDSFRLTIMLSKSWRGVVALARVASAEVAATTSSVGRRPHSALAGCWAATPTLEDFPTTGMSPLGAPRSHVHPRLSIYVPSLSSSRQASKKSGLYG